MKPLTITPGDRVNRLVVIAGIRVPASTFARRNKGATDPGVVVRCDCGQTRTLKASHFYRGAYMSCGCYSRHAASLRAAVRNTTHGQSKHPLYYTWSSMLDRCENPNNSDYPSYGGRGIKVHEEWRDPAAFLSYLDNVLGPRPEGHTLDRIDNDGPYAPGNVRWADVCTQRRNQRRAKAA